MPNTKEQIEEFEAAEGFVGCNFIVLDEINVYNFYGEKIGILIRDDKFEVTRLGMNDKNLGLLLKIKCKRFEKKAYVPFIIITSTVSVKII